MSWQDQEVVYQIEKQNLPVDGWILMDSTSIAFYPDGSSDQDILDVYSKNLYMHIVHTDINGDVITYSYLMDVPTANGNILFEAYAAGQFRIAPDFGTGAPIAFADLNDTDQIIVTRLTNSNLSEASFNSYKFPYLTANELIDNLAFRIQENRKMLEHFGLDVLYFDPYVEGSPLYANIRTVVLDVLANEGLDEPALQADINVVGVNIGQYTSGDVIPADTLLEDILRGILTALTPPVFTLAGTGAKLVESGTTLTPTLTPTWTPNDAGPANAYRLFKNAGLIYSNAVPNGYTEGVFTIGDETVTYQAEVDHDASANIPAGTLTTNVINYVGARAAFFQVGGDAVNIRSNSETLVGVQAGSQLVTIGDDVSLTCIFAYPDALGAPTSLFLQNTGGNFDITSDLVQEADQLVNDASGANPVNYRVYSYTALIAIKSTDTLTLTI